MMVEVMPHYPSTTQLPIDNSKLGLVATPLGYNILTKHGMVKRRIIAYQ